MRMVRYQLVYQTISLRPVINMASYMKNNNHYDLYSHATLFKQTTRDCYHREGNYQDNIDREYTTKGLHINKKKKKNRKSCIQ